MKKLIFLSAFFVISIANLIAQTNVHVSGYVTNSQNGVAIANQAVCYFTNDSSVYGNVITNANGYYSFNASVNNNGGFPSIMVRVADCQNNYIYKKYYNTQNINDTIINFSICRGPQCNADFYYLHNGFNTINQFFFYNISTTNFPNSTVSYLWNFGDGTTSTLENPTHQFIYTPANTSFNVCLTYTVRDNSTNNILCENTICKNVQLYFQTNVHTSGYITNLQNGTAIANHLVYYSTIDSLVNGTALTDATGYYSFNTPVIGNGGFSSVFVSTLDCQNYYHHQNYYNTNNINDTIINFSICDGPQCNTNFNYYHGDSSSTILNQFYFYNTSASNFPNSTVFYLWNFGDGITSTLQNPIHQFIYSPANTSFNVCLTIIVRDNSTNNILCENTICKNVQLYVQTTVHISGYITNIAGNPVSNHEVSYYNYDNYVYGNVLTDANGYYTFNSTFYYNGGFPSIEVRTLDCQNYFHYKTYFNTANINDTIINFSICDDFLCNANYSYGNTDSNTTPPTTTSIFTFYNTSTTNMPNSNISYLWNFGDGTTSTLENPTHVFPAINSTYNVCLTITSSSLNNTCTDIYCSYIMVSDTSGAIIVDTLITPPIDTCLNFIPQNFYISNIQVINNTTVLVTWVFENNGVTQMIDVEYIFNYFGDQMFVLTLVCDGGKGSQTYSGYANISQAMAINENNSSQKFDLYPNPATNSITIEAIPPYNLILNDLTGRVMYQNIINEPAYKLSLNDISEGVYFVTVSQKANTTTKKLIISR